MKLLLKHKYILALVVLFTVFQGCYKDKGNYDYNPLPSAVIIDDKSYVSEYTKVLYSDTLKINPIITYKGNINDLSYEWQMWNSKTYKYEMLQEGKELAYKCVPDKFVSGKGAYYVRLAIRNKSLESDDNNLDANLIFSNTIKLNLVTSLNRGLMVLHGDGVQCDVGLIAHNMFLPLSADTVTTKVIPNFYSYYNNDSKIPGVGRQVVKLGIADEDGRSSNIYVLTDHVGFQTDYETMTKTTLDYSALFINPADASNNPQFLVKKGRESKALIDNGQIYYEYFVGPLMNEEFSYYAAPYAILIGTSAWSGTGNSTGVVAFDTISKAFIYSNYAQGTSYVYKFPNSITGVFEPNDMKANLLYFEQTKSGANALAVMKDIATGNKYLANFNFFAENKESVATSSYSMETLPDAANIKFYAFGGALNETYYATSKTIYQYFYEGGNTATPIFSTPGDEDITMMKIIKYEDSYKSYYQYSNRMMVVGTVDGTGHGKVYSFIIENQTTGALTLSGTFDGTENGGEPFGKIFDVDIKDQ